MKEEREEGERREGEAERERKERKQMVNVSTVHKDFLALLIGQATDN